MFSSFSQPRAVNPEAWDARYEFWRNILTEGLHYGLINPSCFVLEAPGELSFSLCRNQIAPLGLAEVVKEMKARGLVQADFGGADKSLSERLLWSPFWKSWSWVTGKGIPESGLLFPSLLQVPNYWAFNS